MSPATASSQPGRSRERVIWRTIRGWVLRDTSGRTRVVPVVVRHWGHRAKTNLTWRDFRPRPGERIVEALLDGKHALKYSRTRPPGCMRLVAMCKECGSASRGDRDHGAERRRLRAALHEITGQPSTLGAGSSSAWRPAASSGVLAHDARLESLVNFVSTALRLRHLRPKDRVEERLVEDLARHAQLAGIHELEEPDPEE